MPATFTAPWSRQLKWLTALTCILLLGVAVAMRVNAPPEPPLMYRIGSWLPIFVFAAAALFSILGYRIEGRDLLILRPGWHTRIPLRHIESVEFVPDAMANSIRLFGNGGFFGFIGLFRNKSLGRYRAFVTDASHTVVLRVASGTFVLSPSSPEQFVRTIQQQKR